MEQPLPPPLPTRNMEDGFGFTRQQSHTGKSVGFASGGSHYGSLSDSQASSASLFVGMQKSLHAERAGEGFWASFKQSVFSKEKMSFSLWPHFYTAASLAVYGLPSITLAHLATDESVGFWIGPYGYYAPLTLVLIVLLHAVHLKLGPPRLVPVIFSSVVPAALLFALANEHLLATKSKAEMLLSKDCRTFPLKGDVHRSWVVASKVFGQCVNRTAAEFQRSPESVRSIRRFQDCREWTPESDDPWAEHRRTWRYLQRLEVEHHCSGWCFQASPVWTYENPKDACSVSAGAVLMAKVAPAATRMLFYLGITGAVAVAGILKSETKLEL